MLEGWEHCFIRDLIANHDDCGPMAHVGFLDQSFFHRRIAQAFLWLQQAD